MKPKIRSNKAFHQANRLTKRKMKYAHVEKLGASKGKTARVTAVSGALTAMNDSSNRASIERARANNNVNFTLKADVINKKELLANQSNSNGSKSGDSENVLGWIQ